MRNYMAKRYPVIDWLKARDLVMTNMQTGYFPVMLCRPDEIKSWCCIHNETETVGFAFSKRFVTRKLYYAMLVWNFALASLTRGREHLDMPKYRWAPINASFQQLMCKGDDIAVVRDNMCQELRRLADAHIFSVSEGCFLSRKAVNKAMEGSWQHCIDPEMTIVLDNFSEEMEKRQVFDPEVYDHTPISYDWEDIKDYFVDVSVPLLELCNGENINLHTEKDAALFSACSRLDLEGIKDALEHGANPCALNKDGGSAIYACVDDNGLWGRSGATEQKKRCIDFLLEKGVDINLYGYGSGCAPIEYCWLDGDPDLMEYLLDCGAEPNVNSEIDDVIHHDIWYKQSSVLYNIVDDMSMDGETPELLRMKQILLDHKAKMYLDGFDTSTGIWKEHPDLEPWGYNPWGKGQNR